MWNCARMRQVQRYFQIITSPHTHSSLKKRGLVPSPNLLSQNLHQGSRCVRQTSAPKNGRARWSRSSQTGQAPVTTPARGPDHQHEAELLPWVSFTRRPQASRREDCSQAFPPLVRPSGPQVVGSLQEGQGSLAQWEQSGHQTSLPPLHVWVLLTPTTLSYRRVRGQAPCLPADVTGCCLRGWWERETTLLLLLGPVLVTGGSASLAAA